MPEPTSKDLTFEQALEQLETIVQRIESGQSGLEQSIAEYERGVGLIKRCRDILTKAEQRVEELTKADAAKSDPGRNADQTPKASF